MTNSLLTGLRKHGNVAYTENGAVSNRSTLSDVLDFYYHASARRNQDNTLLFANAYAEDKLTALKAAFYVRDIRGGQGERNTFAQVLRYLYTHDRVTFEKIVALIPVYGRWKDVLEFVDSPVVVRMVQQQLINDRDSDTPSLLAKWMPSENASSAATRSLATQWIRKLDSNFLFTTARLYTNKNVYSVVQAYRIMLTGMRAKLVLVETLMSAGQFDKINYAHVPSRAAMLLRKAFSKRDAQRYVAYLESVKKGESKINATTLYPHELVSKYMGFSRGVDETIEAQWKALPNYVEDNDQNAICVVDVSSSMDGLPMQIAIALGLYIAERNTGAFKNHFITFSATPQLLQVKGLTLRDKVKNLEAAPWGGNTNLQAVMDLILTTATYNNVPQHEMPKKLYVVSDMQFDHAMGRYSNFDVIKHKFAASGYEMPTIVFWNVESRRDETPVTMDERGVFLASGYSPSIFKATINAKATNPMEMMLEVLNSDRYAAIEEALV